MSSRLRLELDVIGKQESKRAVYRSGSIQSNSQRVDVDSKDEWRDHTTLKDTLHGSKSDSFAIIHRELERGRPTNETLDDVSFLNVS